MHPVIYNKIKEIVKRRAPVLDKGSVLEIGPNTVFEDCLLSMEILKNMKKVGVNTNFSLENNYYKIIKGSGNDMHALFEDNEFDIVLCNAVLEHDIKFWQTISEINRVCRRGGLILIGVPCFSVKATINENEKKLLNVKEKKNPVLTYGVHNKNIKDYYRFGEDVIDFFIKGCCNKEKEIIMKIPRMIVSGIKK